MKIIPLTKDKFTLVDDEDYNQLNKYKWCVMSQGYAARGIRISGKSYLVLMHRAILNSPKGFDIDHINGNKLDNRKSNLRVCSHSQNQWNRSKQKNNTSGYKGVYLDRRDGAWYSQVLSRQKDKRIVFSSKRYKTPIEAARAYDRMALEHHGEFANLNFKRG